MILVWYRSHNIRAVGLLVLNCFNIRINEDFYLSERIVLTFWVNNCMEVTILKLKKMINFYNKLKFHKFIGKIL